MSMVIKHRTQSDAALPFKANTVESKNTLRFIYSSPNFVIEML